MGLFKSKEEKERERKMEVRRAIAKMEKRIADLERDEAYYIEQAKICIKEDLPERLALTKNALRDAITNKKRTYMMLLNTRVLNQMKESAASTKGFLETVQTISKSIAVNISGVDMRKIQSGLSTAMEQVASRTEELEELLEESQDTFSSQAVKNSTTTDADLEAMIYGEAESAATASDTELDSSIESLKKFL